MDVALLGTQKQSETAASPSWGSVVYGIGGIHASVFCYSLYLIGVVGGCARIVSYPVLGGLDLKCFYPSGRQRSYLGKAFSAWEETDPSLSRALGDRI